MVVVLLLLFKRADSHYVCPERRSSEKESVWRLPQSHPDWVKIYVDPNGQINLCAIQKYEILSVTELTLH